MADEREPPNTTASFAKDGKKPGHAGGETPLAGPHAKEALVDNEKTPGTGALPGKTQPEADVGPD